MTQNVVKMPGKLPPIKWHSTDEIFAQLPETEWAVKGVQIGPGRPTLVAGYGASAKTLSMQSMGLCLAAGQPVWGQFDVKPVRVRHLDYEQGFKASAKRYQRLAIGHGIHPDALGGRLELADMPNVYLNSPGAVDAYATACEGADVVVLDSLRGATPGTDENASEIREHLDALTRVSGKTGTAFVVIHHAGKPKDRDSDARTIARGSSAIFDACGCVLVLQAPKTKGDPRRVTQTKQPAESAGGGVDDFGLQVTDVWEGDDPTAGVRVEYVDLGSEAERTVADDLAAYDSLTSRLLDVVASKPGATANTVCAVAKGTKSRNLAALRDLVDTSRLRALAGPNNSTRYYPIGDHEDD